MLAPHYSSMSIGQYAERARSAADAAGIPFAAIQSWATEPAYVTFLATDVRRRLAAMPAGTKVVFTAHSLPARVLATGDPYPSELRATATAVAAAVGLDPWSQWSIGWQSAGRTPEPWIGPDILAVIDELAAAENGVGLLVCPCGFVADHLEVLYDLDLEARQRAEARRAGLRPHHLAERRSDRARRARRPDRRRRAMTERVFERGHDQAQSSVTGAPAMSCIATHCLRVHQ